MYLCLLREQKQSQTTSNIRERVFLALHLELERAAANARLIFNSIDPDRSSVLGLVVDQIAPKAGEYALCTGGTRVESLGDCKLVRI